MSEGENRFKVVEGSQSVHCCFSATVVDTRYPHRTYHGVTIENKYETVCECFDESVAETICNILNASPDLVGDEEDRRDHLAHIERERALHRYNQSPESLEDFAKWVKETQENSKDLDIKGMWKRAQAMSDDEQAK